MSGWPIRAHYSPRHPDPTPHGNPCIAGAALFGRCQKPRERECRMRKNQWPPRYLAQRGWSVLVLAFAAGLLLSIAPACAQDVLRIPYVADIGTFDPDNGFEIGALSAIDNVYEG